MLGVPLWGWLAVAAAGVAVFIYIRHRGSGAAAPAGTTAGTDPTLAPALGGTPDTSSLPDMSGAAGGGAGAFPDQKLNDAFQNALNMAAHQAIDALNTGDVLGSGIGGGSSADGSGGGSSFDTALGAYADWQNGNQTSTAAAGGKTPHPRPPSFVRAYHASRRPRPRSKPHRPRTTARRVRAPGRRRRY
jgi:hypothetical protein